MDACALALGFLKALPKLAKESSNESLVAVFEKAAMYTRSIAIAAVIGGGLLMFGAPPASAQYEISITPWAGMYVPTSNKFTGVGTDISRSNSFIAGGRLDVWGQSALGGELEVGYAPARISVVGGTINRDENSEVLVSSLKLMIGVSPASSAGGFYVDIGPALIRRGADVTTDNSSVSDWGGVAGLGFRAPFARGR
jgi:hypothetical protein